MTLPGIVTFFTVVLYRKVCTKRTFSGIVTEVSFPRYLNIISLNFTKYFCALYHRDSAKEKSECLSYVTDVIYFKLELAGKVTLFNLGHLLKPVSCISEAGKETDSSELQLLNPFKKIKELGSVTDFRLEQLSKAPAIELKEFGNVTDSRLEQL